MDAALQREARRLFGPDVDLHASAVRPMESAEDVEGRLETASEPRPAEAQAEPPPQGRPLTRSELRRLWAHVGKVDDFWRSLGEIEPGSVARLWQLAVTHQWEVLFLTQRPPSAGQTAQMQSQR
jgi:hypothetical protein